MGASFGCASRSSWTQWAQEAPTIAPTPTDQAPPTDSRLAAVDPD